MHKVTLVFAISLITALLCGCFEQPVKKKVITKPKSNRPVYGGTFRRALSYEYIVLDPAKIKDNNSHEVARQIYDGLVGFDEKGNISPSIARNYIISEDNLVYTFTLRQDITFHSNVGGVPTKNGGRHVTSKDIVYTFKRLLKPNKDFQGAYYLVIKGAKEYNKGLADDISGIKAIDDSTVEFTLEKPFAPFLSLLAMGNAFIVPQEDAESTPLEEMPVGSGPFVWDNRDKTKEKTIHLVANNDYYLGRPWLDRIDFPFIEDGKERFQKFNDGKLSVVDVPDSVYKSVKQDGTLVPFLIEKNIWGVNYLGFNTTIKPFDNVWIRRAASYAIDRESIIKLVLNDKDKIAQGPLPPGIIGYDEQLKGYEYSIEKAKECLAKAGYPNGKGLPQICLCYNQDAMNVRTAEFVQANLCDVGFDCGLQKTDFGTHLAGIEKGTSGMFRLGWTADYPDPDAIVYALFHSSNAETSSNFTRYSNEEVDKLLEQARFETETSKRIQYYREAAKIIVSEAPCVFLHYYSVNLLTQPAVMGFKIGPMGEAVVEYRHIWLAK